MEQTVTAGLVLREVKYSEADRILLILTPQGLVSAAAPHSLSLKSKLLSSCGLFCYSEFTLVPGKNMFRVKEAEELKIFHGLSSSLEKMSLAMYFSEAVQIFNPSGEEAAVVLRLLLNSLYVLNEDKLSAKSVKAVFELRLCGECGFLPQLLGCNMCGLYEGGSFFFDTKEGVLLCEKCAAASGKHPNLDVGSLYALRHACLADDKKLFSFRISPQAENKLSLQAENFFLMHAETVPKSLPFLKSILNN